MPRALAIVLSCTLAVGVASAQNFLATVRGVVRDATGVVPSAEVRLIDEGTGLSRTTLTNPVGEYAFVDVAPGTYRLVAAMRGYRAFERTGLRVATRAFLTIDVALVVGPITERITVRAEPRASEISSASVETLVEGEALHRLPSAGRNVFFSASATPMVLATGDSRFVRQQDQSNSSLISLGGGPRRNNTYVLDGVPIVDVLNRATFIPNFESVEEMRVQISPYDAQVGRTSGGVFNVVARSGSNDWRGSAQWQDRPSWAAGRTFFAATNDIPNPKTYHHLLGGSAGGPLARNRTFFRVSGEGYRSLTTRSTVLVLPTEAERRGDFSKSAARIFDPLTTRSDPDRPGGFIRDPFAGNVIPGSRLNPMSVALLPFLPLPTSGNTRPAIAELVDAAGQLSGKLTQRWTDRLTTSGLYAWYRSSEPDPRFHGKPIFTNPADPGEGALVRRVHLLALNNTWMPGGRTVVETRYGFNSFLDDNRPAAFDPNALGFDAQFLRDAPQRKFPVIGVSGYGGGGGFLGDRTQSTATYYSHVASGAVSTLIGRHSVKAGGEYRVTGVRFLNLGGLGGYNFSRDFTLGPDPNQPAASTGDAFASFLLGAPASGGVSVSSPIDIHLGYWSGFIQDDVRLSPALTLSLGLRYEFEQGVQERRDRMTVGWSFDQPFPVQVAGLRPDGTPLMLTGGLVYAGVDGAAAHQGAPSRTQFAPRIGLAFAANPRTVVRSGYGLFWAPVQGIAADEWASGTIGYNISTPYVATGENPFVPCTGCSLANPFPRGIVQPSGNSLGRLTGVGSTVSFIDPESRMAHFHRYSVGVEREIAGGVVLSAGYVGALGRNLAGSLGGAPLNINQLDSKYQTLGTALQEPVPNPFYGTPLANGILAQPFVQRGQLLRPFPQFDGVYAIRSPLSRSRYDALVVTAGRHLSSGWSAHVNYTWSRLSDSQYSESNFFSGGSGIINNRDVEAEYGLSVVDAPHRVNVNGTLDLPFGAGRRWLNRDGLLPALAGGWSVSAVGSVQSGFPITVHQGLNNSNLFGSSQRPDVVANVSAVLTDTPEDSYDAACGCIRWLNPAAWSQAAPFTFGNAPRSDTRARTPVRRMWDLAIQKSHVVAGKTVSVRAEMINLFNFADLRGPAVSFGDPSFGQIREASGFPRMLQLSVRAIW
jgi:hypothetical protein